MNVHPAIHGALKSITMWAATALLLLGNILPQLPAVMTDFGIDGPTTQKVLNIAGGIMLICRMLTTQSLTDKGSAPILPPPAAQPQQEPKP
jgi:hypothetical protein